MKRLFLALLLLLPLLSSAKTPVEEDILARITDQNSPYYYTGLMMRYELGDEGLTDEDFHYLYYGFAYQDGYKPLATNPDMEQLLALMQGINPDAMTQEQLEAILSVANAAHLRDPFSPKVLNILTFVHESLGNKPEAERWARRMNGILRAIIASGDGLTQRTPRHILMFDHAIDVMTAEGLTHGKARIVSRNVEFIPLAASYVIDGKKRKGIYFDFSRVYWNKPEGYTYKRDRTWQFNNLKPREYK